MKFQSRVASDITDKPACCMSTCVFIIVGMGFLEEILCEEMENQTNHEKGSSIN